MWSTSLLKKALSTSTGSPFDSVCEWSSISEETCLMHVYDAHQDTWSTSSHVAKVESKPFASGSMRTCFRVRKLSSFLDHPTWENASDYVAKRYTRAVDERWNEKMVRTDVRLQSLAKLYAEQFNAFDPPKKIDVMNVFVLEFPDRKDSPCFCVERFLGGEYIKYNSNVGYVGSEHRNTPQAFSHFTFHHSQGKHLVVDVQGVGDLYTDPQIHSSLETDVDRFGDGNLGIGGIALFFHTHRCNDVCRHLQLEPFEHYPFLSLTEPVENENFQTARAQETHWRQARLDGSSMSSFRSCGNRVGRLTTRSSSSERDSSSKPPATLATRIMNDLEMLLKQTPLQHPLRDSLLCECNAIKPILLEIQQDIAVLRSTSRPPQFNTAVTSASHPTLLNDGDAPSHDQITGLIHYEIALHLLANNVLFDIPATTKDLQNAVIFHLRKASDYHLHSASCRLMEMYGGGAGHMNGRGWSILGTEKDEVAMRRYAIRASSGSKVACVRLGRYFHNLPRFCSNNEDDEGSNGTKSNGHDVEGGVSEKATAYREALKYFTQAITMTWSEDDEAIGALELDVKDDEIYAEMGEIYQAGGFGVEMDSEKAAEMYEKAANVAETNFRAKKALMYYELAASLREA